MIAIFTVLGFVLFGGGAYAIYDGWPYLVLERGFTEVIIGSIASSAGLILLALAWVLREIGALRRSLEDGMPMPAAPQAAQAAPAPWQAGHAPWEAARPEPAEKPSVIAPAAVGAVAGAAAAGVAADALAAPSRELPAPPSEEAPKADRDLFGALVAQHLEEPEPAGAEEPDLPPPAAAEPHPDMFAEQSAGKADESGEAPIAIEAESHEPAEIVAAKVQPIAEDEALAHAAEPIVHAEAEREEEEHPAAAQEAKKPAESDAEFDEFSALRESLAGHLNEPVPSGARIEPSLGAEADPFAEAEAWMDKASPRKEPWFESPAAKPEAGTEAAAAPAWPPRTEAPEFAAASEPAAPEAEEVPEAAAEKADDAAPEAAAEAAAEGDRAPAAERAASDEGIVGAYQVGDAHFTIYADGSIRARTPDGEYSFASMDELKVYLASEKSRLGM